MACDAARLFKLLPILGEGEFKIAATLMHVANGTDRASVSQRALAQISKMPKSNVFLFLKRLEECRVIAVIPGAPNRAATYQLLFLAEPAETVPLDRGQWLDRVPPESGQSLERVPPEGGQGLDHSRSMAAPQRSMAAPPSDNGSTTYEPGTKVDARGLTRLTDLQREKVSQSVESILEAKIKSPTIRSGFDGLPAEFGLPTRSVVRFFQEKIEELRGRRYPITSPKLLLTAAREELPGWTQGNTRAITADAHWEEAKARQAEEAHRKPPQRELLPVADLHAQIRAAAAGKGLR